MHTGVMVFDENRQDWRIWIGQDAFETSTGMNFEIYIHHRFYKAIFEEDYYNWFVTIEDDVDFSLRLVETYKVRILEKELIPVIDLPF
ncbi:DUF5348 domain-containing protein [Aquibacillus salsiterrae]|uniref:DUF5348 domain-containing protein n=1 Tax=Aquibacillus salsiterrae TaxID=2950439 RepID=A0A9X3WF63_9BACI|nr:DUF5348 domain-containing protein [Aquibacillus salsiterrae]MDC3418685.1 DUF5348 domain-containing protein [Aquibacillus salsiterrae]